MQNHAVITIISQFTVCHFYFYFLSGILQLKQENEVIDCTNIKNQI